MKQNNLIKRTPYEGCTSTYEDAEIILIGAGFDGTASYRPGSRFAPAAIRSDTLYSQETYSPYFEEDLSEMAVHDAGDIDLPFGNTTQALDLIHDAAAGIIAKEKKPCFIGGEHLISLPVIRAAYQKYPDLRIIQLDAHLDLANSLFGNTLSHGSVMRRAHELLGDGRIYQVGIRSGSKEEYAFAKSHTNLYPYTSRDFLKQISSLLNHPVYLTLDLDVFDPSLIPGTGTPEAGGIFFEEYIEFLKTIAPLNLVGCDIVELAPTIDPSKASTIIASKILRELLIVL